MDEAQSVHIDLTPTEIEKWHVAIETALASGEVDVTEFRNMLAEVRNAAAAADVEIEPTLLRGL
jgi:hypothetical protein